MTKFPGSAHDLLPKPAGVKNRSDIKEFNTISKMLCLFFSKGGRSILLAVDLRKSSTLCLSLDPPSCYRIYQGHSISTNVLGHIFGLNLRRS